MKNRINSFFSLLPLSYLFLSILTLSIAQVATAQIPSNGLVGYWPFNGNANDESGNGNNGTVLGATLTTDRFGNANSAYSFNNNNTEYIEISESPELNNCPEITVSFWTKVLSWSQYNMFIGKTGNNATTWNILSDNANGNVLIFRKTSAPAMPQDYLSSIGVPSFGTWHHLVFSYSFNGSSGSCKFYLDGSLIETYTNTNYLGISNYPIRIGSDGTAVANTVDGFMDDVAIYNRALTLAEITQLYTNPSVTPPVACTPFLGEDQTVCAGTSVTLSASGSSLACPTLPSTLQNGLVGYWPFCGNANDASGNGNNGTVNGATLTTDRFGNTNSAYSFDGVNDRISISHNQALSPSIVTVSLWFNASTFLNSDGNQSQLVSKREFSGWGSAYELGIGKMPPEYLNSSTNTLYTNYTISNNNYTKHYSSSSLTVNDWHQAAYSHDGQYVKFYIDGILVYETPSNGVLSDPGQLPLWFGGRPGGIGRSFYNGLLDEIAIYNRVLTASEIQQLYTLGQSTYLWSTGATTASISVTPTQTTTYTCTVTDANGNACTDSVTVFVPQIEATDLTLCAGESTTLSVSGINSTATPSACPTLPSNLQTGLAGYWPFCGNANDASGNGNNGTVNGATLTTDRFGNANNSYSFNGNGNHIEIPNSPSLNPSQISFSFWGFFNTGNCGVLDKVDQSTPENYSYSLIHNFLNENGFFTGWNTTGQCNWPVLTGYTFGPNAILNNLTWKHVAVTIDSNGLCKQYIDGQLTHTYTGLPLNTCSSLNSKLFIGRQWLDDPCWMNGKLDDLSIYNRALTLSEIQQLFTLGQTTYLWSTGATTPTIDVSPTSTTTYTCAVTTNGVTCTDSVTVEVNNPTIDLGSDVTVCGTSTTLTAPAGFDTYAWSNGGTTNTTTVNANGTYTCTVTQGLCSASDSIDVTLIDTTISATDSVICAGETITLSVPQGGSSSTACAALPTNLQTGLVGYWPFCGNANDASGNGNNGTVNGATLTTDRFGNANSAYSFDGVNDYISANGSYPLGNSSRSISAWLYVNQFVIDAGIVGWGQFNTNSYSAIGISPVLGKLFYWTYSNDITSSQQINSNQWIHVAVTYDQNINNGKIYINGVLDVSANISPIATILGDLNIGRSLQNNGTYFNGKLDDISIYNRSLSAGEIQQLFTLGQTTYLWSNGATTPTINVSPTTTTTYTCTVTTNGVSCTDTITVVVGNPVASITPNGIVEICEGESIALTGNGGVSYLWNTGAPTQSITVNTEAFYTVTVTDANGCTDTESQLVKVNFLPNIGVSNASICAGQSATLTASGGVSYVWSPATGLSATTGSTVTASPATSTVYTVTGTGANGCTNTATAAVAVNALPTATITPASATTFCQGGSVVLNANTGTGLSYQWFNNATAISGATSASYTATTSGSYTVVVTNASTCSSTSTATVVTVNALPAATITPASATTFCQGGSVVLNANTGAGLTYQWRLNGNPISGATSSSYTANASGSYTVVVTNASTCSITSTATVVTVNALPTATITPATATTFCQGGSVVLNANTGAGLSYQWRLNGNPISGATSSSYTANASGSYTVVVTNASTCSSTSVATVVTVNALPTATMTASSATTFCQGGSVVLTANTGAGLSYQWFNNANAISGATSASYTASMSGSYTVVVTNASTCSLTSTATVVTVNALPTATITPATATTFCQGVSVVLNANTGTGLSYQWRLNGNPISGATSSSYTANASGSYTVVVTNASTCSAISTATVVTVNALPTATITAATATTFCQGGSVVLNANTGAGLSYQWFNNATAISGATSTSYTATTSGSYTVTVTNASTCSAISTATVVTVNALPTATITAATATTFCQGGSVVLNANTGAGLTYQWRLNGNPISGATSSSYTANASGSYTVVVTNASTCSSTSTAIVVTVNTLPVATITPATTTTFCQGASVVLTANTGAGLSYQWLNNASSISGATSASYTATISGSYTVVVTNTSTCSSTSTATVVTVNALPTATITPATATTFCQGGSVVLNANTGAGLTYQWRLNGNPISGATSSSYTANASGSYTVVVTNASTCSSTSTATVVTVNALPTATITASSATTFCQGGSVVLTANTGAGLSYQWRLNGNPISGATSSSYTANASGSYTVVVTNASTCSSTSTATVVTVNPLPTATITPATATTFCQGGSVVLNANTGAGLTYQWFNNATSITGATSASFTATTSGSYTVVVTNASTCSSTSTATVVTVNALPVASISPNGLVEICQGQSIALTANGGVSYLWSTGAPTQSITVNTEALYTVTVTDINGCTDTESQFVKVNQLPNVAVNNASICLGQSATLTATGGLSYVWSPVTGLSATTGSTVSSSTTSTTVYTVIGTGANGCTNSATATVTVNALPMATITPATATTFCQGGSVVLNANTGAGLTYQWFNNISAISGATSASYTATTSGSYTVTVTNASTCSSTSTAVDVTTIANADYFADFDGDGFGDATTLISTCAQPQGYVSDNTDCDDNDATVNTAATEVCNHIDDDCNGLIDDGITFNTYYADNDGDSFGDANNSIDECSQPAGYVTNNTDCNDNNVNQNVASAEICNGEDDDCDGTIDNGLVFLDYYVDADGDGFGTGDVISSCTDLGAGYTDNNSDCDDTNGGIYPGAEELCNSIDDNCDGQTDDGTLTVFFIDNDGDTYGNPSVSILACIQPDGYTPDDNDCNDNDANINPGAEDIGGNGIDENCDGEIDNSIFELNASINLYPNPSRSELNIQISNALVGNDMYIFDAVGKLVYKQQLLSTQTTLSMSEYADGNYIFRVGEVVKRFVVEK